MPRPVDFAAVLRQAGFASAQRAQTWLADPNLTEITDSQTLLGLLQHSVDPDLSLLSLVRLAEAASAEDAKLASNAAASAQATELSNPPTPARPPEPPGPPSADEIAEKPPCQPLPTIMRALKCVLQNPDSARRLLGVLGASQALGDYLVSHPADLALLAPNPNPDPSRLVGARTTEELRRAYRREIIHIAAADITSPEPVQHMPTVGKQMARLVDAALATALEIAKTRVPEAKDLKFAIIALGKTGAEELNYISDVDVVYVVGETGQSEPTHQDLAGAERLAMTLGAICSAPGSEPPLWPIDVALRPEGKDGALVRTVASHLHYYQRWAKSWEFQALLKARYVAGDSALGAKYLSAITPLVWQASLHEGFVQDARAMRQRVEANISRQEAHRQLKLGPGGLRDVEFTVQLLQLVHGKTDDSLRCANTFTALERLSQGGYVGRKDAEELGECYRFLRTVEHRTQLYKLSRTHLLPTEESALRRIGRGIDPEKYGQGPQLAAQVEVVRRKVRHLHEEIFYRPLLPAVACLSPDEITLSPQAADARLAALGYRDPKGALNHITALTSGLSRRAAIQRQLLPVMLGWLANGANPDTGLLAFRRLSEALGDSHWYMRLLRDSSLAASRLCWILPNAVYVADGMISHPESVQWLDDTKFTPRTAEQLSREVDAILERHEDPVLAALALRSMRQRELLRAGMADVLDGVDISRHASIVSQTMEAVLAGALELALRQVEVEQGLLYARHLIVAMGRLGGAECGYASDADVVFIYEPLVDTAVATGEVADKAARPGEEAADRTAREAQQVAELVREFLGAPGECPPLKVDVDLRPEGRAGPLARTFSSYQEYFARWAAPWEYQALLRARPVAGDSDFKERYQTYVDELRWNRPWSVDDMRQVRRLKARMETERMPRGISPKRHVKLGPGGLSDVEWAVQFLQLQHARQYPALRTTSTLGALRAAVEAGLIEYGEAEALEQSWGLATRIRAANVLASGKTSGPRLDVLPEIMGDLASVARVLGYRPGIQPDLEEDYLRLSRRARVIAEKILYE